ncbi:MAG: LamB/YcsF family protein, partial [Chitinophagaceae bacterium]
VEQKAVTTASGKKISIHAETVSIHGDGKHAVAFAEKLHTALHKFIA